MLDEFIKEHYGLNEWKPDGDNNREYYYVHIDKNGLASVGKDIWENGNTENEWLEAGLIFKTKAEANNKAILLNKN